MKIVIFAVAIGLLFIGCYSIKGVSDSKNRKQEPYFFQYRGTADECKKDIKNMLFVNGFTIDKEDTSIGTIITQWKSLQEDERVDLGIGFAMMGVRAQSQHGSLRIQIKDLDTSVVCSFTGWHTMNLSAATNTFKDNTSQSEYTLLPQGHPLPMKIRINLVNTKKFILMK
jgi:uncharacterized lipoprotein